MTLIHKENAGDRDKHVALVKNFLQSHRLAALATVDGNALPQAAVVGIGVLDSLEIIFGTHTESRKHANILKNPRVALVIGWDHGKTVQYHGIAKRLAPEEAEEHLKTTFAHSPTAAKFIDSEKRVMYKVTPLWVRFSDTSRDPLDEFELDFN